MILTGSAIKEAVERGEITFYPFDADMINPNSVNYRLGPQLKVQTGTVADPRTPAQLETIDLPADGYVLQPGITYLGATIERIGSHRYVPSLIGRSSLGRLGCFLQVSADLGQLGSVHQWTLEIVVVQPLRVYPGMRTGQVSFWEPSGQVMPYLGTYGYLSVPSAWSPQAVAGDVRTPEVLA
ncbi:dCTP deaminase [Streptomyces caniscabiei]|uniref:dCTP deaminase n=1 Tax=Streptomyces caniscabiei TaxID=2746961 RepID=UPI000A3C6885|nr:2'-deoxycytidine 5'-triphosphate deaminase [Streptomyces caniscabiei]